MPTATENWLALEDGPSGAALLSLVFALFSWVIEGVTPSWIVFPIFLIIGLVRTRRAAVLARSGSV